MSDPAELTAKMNPFRAEAKTSDKLPAEDLVRETGELLEICRKWILKYVVLSDTQAIIIAAWILHTYTFETSENTPYLQITAAELECGKSTLMQAIAAISSGAIRSAGMSCAALIRTIDLKRPSLFLDEMDAQLNGDKEFAETIRGILNEGYYREGKFYKCNGKNHDLREFNAYCPKAFAGIGKLPETVASRSIPIELRRKLPEERVSPFRAREVKESSAPIRVKLQAWKDSGVAGQLEVIRPASLSELGDRQNDIAEPLLAIATLDGPGWFQRLSNALIEILGKTRGENVSLGVTLLHDIRVIFDELGTDRVWSETLTQHLRELEGSSWSEWRGIKGFTKNHLAQQLKRYRIYSKKVRIGPETKQGYMRSFFEDEWERYCPAYLHPAIANGTMEHPASLLDKSALSKRNTNGTKMEQHGNVPDCSVSVPFPKSGADPHEQRSVPDVPDRGGLWTDGNDDFADEEGYREVIL